MADPSRPLADQFANLNTGSAGYPGAGGQEALPWLVA
jgi:hypothetical protein